jgi:hypothetical protein
MSTKVQIIIAAAAISVAFAASGAAAHVSLENGSIVREIGPSAAALVIGVRDQGQFEEIITRSTEGVESHIVQTGIWSSVKNGVKSVGSKAADAAKGIKNGVKGAATKARDGAYSAAGAVKNGVKKAVTTTVKNLTPPVVHKAKKLVQKIMTPVGKKLAKVVS